MGEVAAGVSFDIIAREWRCKVQVVRGLREGVARTGAGPFSSSSSSSSSSGSSSSSSGSSRGMRDNNNP